MAMHSHQYNYINHVTGLYKRNEEARNIDLQTDNYSHDFLLYRSSQIINSKNDDRALQLKKRDDEMDLFIEETMSTGEPKHEEM
jgi:hypothetical protein